MSAYETHVFLGPTLDLQTAKSYLNDAHYHPPVQCGDMIRLLRLQPKRIILIDGLYEQVPAVWHKEIMLALEQGIEVYGAASMGALRAAELHRYGMIGIGKIFQDFATNQLTDDDEVAVLHQDIAQGSLPLNDAMVNIRETLAQAYQAKIISSPMQQALLTHCKSQFYFNRSLKRAIMQMDAEYQEERLNLCDWLNQYGIIDVKRQDAIAVLEYVQKAPLPLTDRQPKQGKTGAIPYTKFIASLVDDVVATAFSTVQSWFPDKEKTLTLLSLQNPETYHLITELARLIKNAYSVINAEELLDNDTHYLHYIEEHQLYFPPKLYQFFSHHQELSALYFWMLHYTCLGNITEQIIKSYLPAMAFYFDCDVILDSQSNLELLSYTLLFILLLHQQLNDEQLAIKRSIFEEHLQEIHFWRRYKQHKGRDDAHDSSSEVLDIKRALDFVMIYMKITYIHHGVKDFKLGLAKIPNYFHWVYDAMTLYAQTDC
ncbi:TfuA-like protein [Legionella fallonii]|uniref:TfuA-like core domain-containing protein n=1 Tax=Legionella fallonii LLAP-10 TaxID=1212491 RepID=A0A098FZU6_9GAMM|nr:TfuA-like protein [Legionella fallonii]CEG55753.1 protein of unknown function [TfuA-like domain] [Legionella fallonii LLAP-10]